MRSRLLSVVASVFATSAVLLPSQVARATACDPDVATMVSSASSPTSVTFTGSELGTPAIHELWDLTTGENNNKFQILGKAIGVAHDWFGNCTYPGLGIGNGSGFDVDSRNITLWSWANGVNPDIARAAIYGYLGISAGTATWSSPTITLTDTPFVFDARGILGKFSSQQYEWDLDGDDVYEVSTGNSPTTMHSFATTGTKSVGVRVSASGVVRTASMSVEVFLQPPHGDVGISLNNGAARTSTRSVTVSVVWPTWATGMRVSNDGGFATGNTSTLPLTRQFDWELEDAGYGTYGTNVFIRFIGSRVESSRVYFDSIVLDQPEPTTTTTSTTSTTSTTTTVPPGDAMVVSSASVRALGVAALSSTAPQQRTKTVVVVLAKSRSVCALRGSRVVGLSRGLCFVRVTTHFPHGKSVTKVATIRMKKS